MKNKDIKHYPEIIHGSGAGYTYLPNATVAFYKNYENGFWEITASTDYDYLEGINDRKVVITGLFSAKEARKKAQRYLIENFLKPWLATLGYELIDKELKNQEGNESKER